MSIGKLSTLILIVKYCHLLSFIVTLGHWTMKLYRINIIITDTCVNYRNLIKNRIGDEDDD